MAEFDKLKNLFLKLPDFTPVIKGWNRLEGRPRQLDLERSLKAEVRDPLWMLTRQWQLGEFQGEDAGSPIEVQLTTHQDQSSHYAFSQEALRPMKQDMPVAAMMEAEAWPRDMSMALGIGRYFCKLLRKNALDSFIPLYLEHYPVAESYLEGNLSAQDINTYDAVKGKMIDGIKLIDSILSGTHEQWLDQQSVIHITDKTKLKNTEPLLIQWFDKHYIQSPINPQASWSKERLEYQFRIASETGSKNILIAEQHEGQPLDWYSYDHASGASVPGSSHQKTEKISSIPSPVTFTGMPLPRYWEIESTIIEWSNLDLRKRDLIQMVLIEFMLTYANDWCVIPYERTAGSICEIENMMVTDTFGNKVLIRPYSKVGDSDHDRWSFMKLNTIDGQLVEYAYLPYAPGKPQESAPIEKINFIRDEMANMVWAIENTIPSILGAGLNGYETALANTIEPSADINTSPEAVKYVLGHLPPANWIPFIPVRLPGSSSEIKLQRGKLPGTDKSYKGKILDHSSPYFIYEEEVPRAGKQIQRRYVRTRNHKGETFLWIGRKVNTGKGEGSSGMLWDLVE
jgi:hypothetical protein